MKGILNIEIESLEKLAKKYVSFIDNCSSFSLVLREEVKLNSSGEEFVNSLESFLLKTEVKSEWPGTILTDGKANVFYYRLNNDSLKILCQLNSLFDLVAPSFLEDICFYKNNEPFLITISHEKDLYFQINKADIVMLEKKLAKEGIENMNWLSLESEKIK